jgi:hypothetical protein
MSPWGFLPVKGETVAQTALTRKEIPRTSAQLVPAPPSDSLYFRPRREIDGLIPALDVFRIHHHVSLPGRDTFESVILPLQLIPVDSMDKLSFDAQQSGRQDANPGRRRR